MQTENAVCEWLPLERYDRLKAFLAENGLMWEGAPDRAAVIRNGDEICASAAILGNVIKYVAVGVKYRANGWSAAPVSQIIEDAYLRGITHLFLFTRAEKAEAFEGVGFRMICEYEGVALLECGFGGVERFTEKLRKYRHPGKNGAIVMNANPFTIGHRYLIEEASKRTDRLHVFMVRENGSVFPFEDRYEMVKNGTSDLENVIVHRGSEYILSHVTFPSYFIKASDEKSFWQAGLDVELFRRHIARALDIRVRFAGEEPFDKATDGYNRKMREILEPDGICVHQIKRLEIDGTMVSASLVRKYLKDGETEKALSLVPQATKEYLASPKGETVIGRLREA